MKNLIQNLVETYTKYIKYKQTYRELQSLSDYELKDIGISRHNIPQIAREVYYR